MLQSFAVAVETSMVAFSKSIVIILPCLDM